MRSDLLASACAFLILFTCSPAFSEDLKALCATGDAASCMKYSAALNQACTLQTHKIPIDTLICESDVQCYQDKALGLQQYDASCSGSNASSQTCALMKKRTDAACPTRNPNGSLFVSAAEAKAYEQAVVGLGHSVAIDWAPISASSGGRANAKNYKTMTFVGGYDDDQQNFAYDKIVRRPEYVCFSGILDNGKVVVVPGKWISDRCNAVWNNKYVVTSDFYAATRYPTDAHGHWGQLKEQSDANRLKITPLPTLSGSVPIDVNTKLVPCMAHYSYEEGAVDQVVDSLLGGSKIIDTGDQLGYLVGNSCRFEFGGSQVTKDDHVRVYYLTYRPAPVNPRPITLPPTSLKPGAQGRSWTIRSIHQNPVNIYVYEHKLVAGAIFDCRPLQFARSLDQNTNWTFWVPSGSVVDYRAFEVPLDSNGVCSGNFITMDSLDGGPGAQSVSTIN